MKEETEYTGQAREGDFSENIYGEKEYYISNVGLSPVPQKQLEAFANINFGRHVFQKDLETLSWIADTVQKIEEAECGEEEIDASDLKVGLLDYLLSRNFTRSTRMQLPPLFEQFTAISHNVFILTRTCAVVITKVPLAIRQQVIDDILLHIMDVPQITLEAKITFKRCAEAGKIITLSPFETKKAAYSVPKTIKIIENLMKEYEPGDNDDNPSFLN